MTSNPLIEAAPEVTTEPHKPKIRELMRDGVWQVPPEDRPRGWEKMMEIREPETTTVRLAPLPAPVATKPVRKESLPTEPTRTVKESLAVAKHERHEPAGPLPCALKELPTKTPSEPDGSGESHYYDRGSTKWGDLQERLIALPIGGSVVVPTPPDEAPGKFQNRLHSILSAWKGTDPFLWSITKDEGDFFEVTKKALRNLSTSAASPTQEGNHTDPATRAQAEQLLLAGASLRTVAKQTGLAKNTVMRIRAGLGELPLCECGKAGGHRGWCAPLLAKSPARRETMRKMHEKQREVAPAPPPKQQPANVYAEVIADLEAKRAAINNAIAALKSAAERLTVNCGLFYKRQLLIK